MTVDSPGPVNERVEKIISQGRQLRPGASGTLLLVLLSSLLSWASFTPVDAGFLGWVCLVPVLMLVRVRDRTRWMYRCSFLGSLLFWLATLQWMRLGDPTMYIALVALATYLAFYLPLFLALTRTAVWKLGVPMWIAAPVFWTGLEYLRAYVFTGFSWYYIGHTQHHWIEIVQISDLVGAYGVSFLVVLANAALAEVIPLTWLSRLNLQNREQIDRPLTQTPLLRSAAPVAVSVLAVVAALGYGSFRRAQAQFQAGPRVALIQGNFAASVKSDQEQWGEIFRTHHFLTGKTIPFQPDVIVWPESMFRYAMFTYEDSMSDEELEALHDYIRAEDWKSTASQDKLIEISQMADAALIVGIPALEATPEGYFDYNSAAFVRPDEGFSSRYDKIHRVPFGEYIPLADQLGFLQSLTPYRGDFGIDAGTRVKVFEYNDWRIIPMICFEDTVPHLVRDMVKQSSNSEARQIDVLVNVTNDGWFHGSSELDQHLITSGFRAIETRTPIVRAVNTGISVVIDGDGVVREPAHIIDLDAEINGDEPRTTLRDPKTGKFYRQVNWAIVDDVPLDSRTSFYVRYGDWFAAICLVACIAVALQSILLLSQSRKSQNAE